MPLTSMKLSKQDSDSEIEVAVNQPDYPYGLSISLHEDQIDKLGLDLPNVGDEMMLEAVVVVRSVSQHKSEDHEGKGLELQITDMSLGKKQKSLADALYK